MNGHPFLYSLDIISKNRKLWLYLVGRNSILCLAFLQVALKQVGRMESLLGSESKLESGRGGWPPLRISCSAHSYIRDEEKRGSWGGEPQSIPQRENALTSESRVWERLRETEANCQERDWGCRLQNLRWKRDGDSEGKIVGVKK